MSPELVHFKKTHVFSKAGTIDELRADLEALRSMDLHAEKQSSFWGKLGCGGIVLGILGFCGGVFSEFEMKELIFIVIGIGGSLAFVGLMMAWIEGKGDVDNRRYELVLCMLHLLGKDSRPDAQLSLHLDLRPPNHKHKFQRKGMAGTWKVKYYTDAWLKLQGRLMDGTGYQFTMTDLHQDRGRWKRGRSGKNKYKTKTKCTTRAMVQLRVKPARYPKLAAVSPKAGMLVKVPGWTICRRVETHATGVVLGVQTKTGWSVEHVGQKAKPIHKGDYMVALMFLSAYQILHAAKALENQA